MYLPYVYCLGSFPESQINILPEVTSSRLTNLILDKKLIGSWKELQKKAAKNNKKIWESELYRLERVCVFDGNLDIVLSTIPFSVRKMTTSFLSEVLNLGEGYFSKGMFSSIFVKTTDNLYSFLKKSDRYESRNNYSFVGGTYSKTEKIIRNSHDFFESAKKEMYEEINITPENIIFFNLISVFITSQTHVCCLFYCSLNLSSGELTKKYQSNHDRESSELIELPVEKIMGFLTQNLPGDLFKTKLFKKALPKIDLSRPIIP